MPLPDKRSRALLLWEANKRARVILCCGESNSTLRTEFLDHGFWRVQDAGTFETFLGVTNSTFGSAKP
jgi:hypothetical protein